MDRETRPMLEKSRCWNCSRVISTLKCSSCGAVSSTKGYYQRADELALEIKRHKGDI